MLTAALLLSLLAPVIPITIHILRNIVDRRRLQREGLGGTQDIAMWGTLVMFVWLLATITCWILALST